MPRPRHSMAALAFVLAAAFASSAAARTEEATIRAAQEVLAQFLELHIKEIPDSLLAESHGVVIIPDVIKLGFVVGGQRGKGVMAVREKDGSWRGPVFVTITGGSIGWQVGAQSTDFMLVFKSQKSVDGLMKGKFTLGADAAIAAGPLGRRAGAATDTELKAEIYSYSRSRGLFAGVSLDGSALQIDHDANLAYYGVTPPGGAPPPVPDSAQKLIESIARLTANPVIPSEAISGPVPAPPVAGAPATRPAPDLEALQAELATAASRLQPLLDDAWQRHLALPPELYQRGRRPTAESIQDALARFSAIERDERYRALTQRPEFQTTISLLRAYSAALSARTSQLNLPPPPGGRAR